ncbi:MAG TPA: sugar transferase [Elainellaceae cyanobacterium]
MMDDMSLIGTRPPTLDEVTHYQPHHYQRLHVKPGMSGEWQVSGRSDIDDFEDVIKLDMAYQGKGSIGYDVALWPCGLRFVFRPGARGLNTFSVLARERKAILGML